MNGKSDELVRKLFDINVQQIADIGAIKAKVDNIEKKLVQQNGTIAAVCEKVAKHDIVFGKIGVGITAGVFILSTAINFLIDWIRNKL